MTVTTKVSAICQAALQDLFTRRVSEVVREPDYSWGDGSRGVAHLDFAKVGSKRGRDEGQLRSREDPYRPALRTHPGNSLAASATILESQAPCW